MAAGRPGQCYWESHSLLDLRLRMLLREQANRHGADRRWPAEDPPQITPDGPVGGVHEITVAGCVGSVLPVLHDITAGATAIRAPALKRAIRANKPTDVPNIHPI